ncbi:MAG: hypothetical protein PUB28_00835 [Roseburia sp.]|uniref:hypothetical protein n=1 Tax=Roseburia sp. 831b TaxID=1261635 RepID=UPI00156B8EB2|nr:hypothetical protein [Roseburia sp. 831b]MDD6215286.1 hypothetical protein [Roseburia sp.]WVK73487.1 hypothetical protein BIV16_02975 [Roseburia sp. 831b]
MSSYIAPAIEKQFRTLSPELRSLILERNVNLQNLRDLIQVLEDIVAEGEAE